MPASSVDYLRYHDFHLRGYSVYEGGERITLDLVYDYPGEDRVQSLITFSDVACYSFVHTYGAIVTDIFETPVASLVSDEAAFFNENSRLYGVRFWKNDLEHYVATLQQNCLRAWEIISAMGFYGFVIARSVEGHVAPCSDPYRP